MRGPVTQPGTFLSSLPQHSLQGRKEQTKFIFNESSKDADVYVKQGCSRITRERIHGCTLSPFHKREETRIP